MLNMQRLLMFIVAAVWLTNWSCAKSPSRASKGGKGESPAEKKEKDEDESSSPEGDPLALTCSASGGKTYKGFGDKDLSAGREDDVTPLGDRARIKPFSALSGEFNRVLQVIPGSLTANAATFGDPGERWFSEAAVNGVSLFTTYRAAYEAALRYAATNPMLAAAPTEGDAASICSSIAALAWNRTPTGDEVEACKKIAVTETVNEPDPKARWAYAIASLLTATGFISY